MNPLVRVLHDPAVVRGWDVADWNRFLPQARNARLLGRCLNLFDEHGLLDIVPGRTHDQLRGALAQTRYVQGQATREWRAVTRVLGAEGIEVLPLKGVAYLLAELPPAGWRNLSDIDLLVAKDDVEPAECLLQHAGWQPSGEFDAYDQHYYRAWMHEVPPLMHRSREVEVDLHHNLAPPVSRLRIDAALLWRDAVDVVVGDGRTIRMLAPVDLMLHNAIHLFMNDELRGGLRDVVDFRDLFVHFTADQPDFEQRLLARAEELGCCRALYYAVVTAQRLAGLTPSPAFTASVVQFAPAAPVRHLMQMLIDQVLAPERPGARPQALAGQLMFIRSHWIRMPPGMLLRHLVHKQFKLGKTPPLATDLPG